MNKKPMTRETAKRGSGSVNLLVSRRPFLSAALRDEIADILAEDHDAWLRFARKQPPNPAKGINIKRGIAQIKMRRLRELVGLLAPKKLAAAKSAVILRQARGEPFC